MKTFFVLAILFSTPDNLVPHMQEGFDPRPQPDLATCLKRRDFMADYLAQETPPKYFRIACIAYTPLGYNEAVDDLRRSTTETN